MPRARSHRPQPALANVAALPTRAVVETGTAYELLLSLLHAADPAARKRFVEADTWQRRSKAVGSRQLAVLARLGHHPVFNLVGIAHDVPPPRSAGDLLAYLASVPPSEIVLTALGAYRRVYRQLTPPDVMRAAAAGDAAARRELLRTSWPDVPEWQTSARFLLSRHADELGAQLRDAIAAWHEHAFAPEEERVREAQLGSREALLAERETWSVDALSARVLPGVDYVPPAGIGEVIFVPDTVIRPAFVFVDHRTDSIATFPLILGEGETDEPPDQLVRLGKALGDPLRLRALRILARGPMTMVELAAELRVPRTSLAHHIGVLRSAGLISVGVDDGRWGRLRLRADGIDAAPALLHRYLDEED